ncbi:hypothetical protein Cni_G25214 [Canna indica]|uniref:Uncharacterized protein n=1 Tax=Canna indica TaxID=4628 RepID=A0AAQ3L3W8_9LILI|nr:hypothetical protein Cni_G25214 [Canna indica]
MEGEGYHDIRNICEYHPRFFCVEGDQQTPKSTMQYNEEKILKAWGCLANATHLHSSLTELYASISKKNLAKTRCIRSKTINSFAPTSSPINKLAPRGLHRLPPNLLPFLRWQPFSRLYSPRAMAPHPLLLTGKHFLCLLLLPRGPLGGAAASANDRRHHTGPSSSRDVSFVGLGVGDVGINSVLDGALFVKKCGVLASGASHPFPHSWCRKILSFFRL